MTNETNGNLNGQTAPVNGAHPVPRRIVHIQSTLQVLVGEEEGRSIVRRFPLTEESGLLVPHKLENYALLYQRIEDAMDKLQAELDQNAGSTEIALAPPPATAETPVPAGSF